MRQEKFLGMDILLYQGLESVYEVLCASEKVGLILCVSEVGLQVLETLGGLAPA